MKEKEILQRSINEIKNYLKEERDASVKAGLYRALDIIRNRIIIVDEDLLKEFNLEEETEKYL